MSLALEHTYVIGELPPDPARVHWSKVQRAKKRYHAEFAAWAMVDRVARCEPGERRRVRVVMYRPGPVSDVDNAARRLKAVLDGLVRARLLEDDKPACVDVEWDTVSARPTRTEVTLGPA